MTKASELLKTLKESPAEDDDWATGVPQRLWQEQLDAMKSMLSALSPLDAVLKKVRTTGMGWSYMGTQLYKEYTDLVKELETSEKEAVLALKTIKSGDADPSQRGMQSKKS